MDINTDKCSLAQIFGANANPSYKGVGLKGHTGFDDMCGFGSLIHSPFDMVVYKVLTKDAPAHDGSGFTGVFGIVDNGIETFEYLVGHCNPIVAAGQFIKAGDTIGTEANHGTVYQGDLQITLAMQAKGDQRGHHRHNQKRPVMKVLQTSPNFRYLDNYSDLPAGSIYHDHNGFYYQIWDYNNGYNGCIDPQKSVFNRDLQIGVGGYDVYVLQRILKKEGWGAFEPTGYFGTLTQQALAKFQDKIGIHPDVGYFGPLTRSAVINTYKI